MVIIFQHQKKQHFGLVFNVSNKSPKLDGKYFIGWSLEKDGSVQWLADGIIEPKYITTNTTLYAVYSETPPKLSDMVSVGDFVDYPAEYTNVYTGVSTRMESTKY